MKKKIYKYDSRHETVLLMAYDYIKKSNTDSISGSIISQMLLGINIAPPVASIALQGLVRLGYLKKYYKNYASTEEGWKKYQEANVVRKNKENNETILYA